MTVLDSVVLSVGAATDVGLRRQVNEDSLLVERPVYLVADGMGGHDAGDKASQAVVAQLRVLVGSPAVSTEHLAAAIDAAHAQVRGIGDLTSRGAGSTLTGAVLVEQADRAHWLVFNIGDSRVYRLRAGTFEQLTVDHSLVQGLVDAGTLAKSEMSTYKGRNVITKAVGADESDPDYWLYPITTGETLLVCSDGLTGEVSDDSIAEVLASGGEPQVAADRLVELALAGGGRDNVTVVVVSVLAGGVDPHLVDTTTVASWPRVDDELDENTVEMPHRGGR